MDAGNKHRRCIQGCTISTQVYEWNGVFLHALDTKSTREVKLVDSQTLIAVWTGTLPCLYFSTFNNDFSSQYGQAGQQLAIVLEERPQYIWHGKRDAFVGHVWKCDPLLALPLLRISLAATRAAS